MCNTDRDPNKGKEKVNEEPIVDFKTMEIQNNENKRKAIVLVESDVDADEEESTNSSKEFVPFLLFGFIIDPNNGLKHAYSCDFCSRKFISPQALGGHQNCHKQEKRLKKWTEDMNNDWINYLIGNGTIPCHGGYGYQYNGYYDNMTELAVSSNFNAGNLLGALHYNPQIGEVINEAGQGTMSQQITMTEIGHGSISNGGADSDDAEPEDKETEKKKESKIDFTLKL